MLQDIASVRVYQLASKDVRKLFKFSREFAPKLLIVDPPKEEKKSCEKSDKAENNIEILAVSAQNT